jgi:hypothetical protein
MDAIATALVNAWREAVRHVRFAAYEASKRTGGSKIDDDPERSNLISVSGGNLDRMI